MWAVCYCIRLKTRHVQNPSIEPAQSARYSQSSSHPEETCDECPPQLLVNVPVALSSRSLARCVPPTWNRGRLHLPQGQPRPHPLSMPGWPPWFATHRQPWHRQGFRYRRHLAQRLVGQCQKQRWHHLPARQPGQCARQ